MTHRLLQKMQTLNILEEDIEETFVRSSGPGGQNVNKISSCVILKHIPTGLKIKCQTERSQKQNRLKARELLLEKMEAYYREKQLKERLASEKIKRQNRKKPKSLKEEILKQKKQQAQKKIFRKKIDTRDLEKY